MDLNGHYGQLLGLDAHWRVTDVDLALERQRVEIAVEWVGGKDAPCPECGSACALYDLREERRWRHLDTMQFETVIRSRAPRCRCPEHGVQTISVPWADKHGRFTLMFEAFAIRVLQACSNVEAARKLLGLSWQQADEIRTRAVARGLKRRGEEALERVGLDEKSFGSHHDYISVMSDLDEGRVLEVVPGRRQEAAESLLLTLSARQRQGVLAVALDMWPAFMSAAEKHLPEATLANSIKGIGSKEATGLHYIGNKSSTETGNCRVYLALGCSSSETMEARLHALADPTSAAVLVLPQDIGIGHSAKLSSLGVFIATLDADFAIHWPQNIQLSPHMQNTVNRELVAKVDAGFKQVGVNISELKGENDLLKSALADKMTHLANEVEPEYYTWMMHVLATGSVSGAAKLVGMANSTFTDKLKAYRARGGVYETLFQIHEVRRRTMGTKKVERYNDMYAAHQQSESTNDSDLLRDVFEAFRDQNSANWEAIRSEMLEVLQDVVP